MSLVPTYDLLQFVGAKSDHSLLTRIWYPSFSLRIYILVSDWLVLLAILTCDKSNPKYENWHEINNQSSLMHEKNIKIPKCENIEKRDKYA